MRVLMINAVCGSGSTGRIVTDLCKELKAQGHEVKVVYGVGHATNIDEKDTIRMNNKAGYYIHNALAKITDHTGLYSTPQTRWMIRKIKEFAPDVIHLHNLHGYYINYKILFEFLAEYDRPVIWTLHDCWAFTGHCAHFSTLKCDKWKTHCCDCPGLRGYPACFTSGDVGKNYELKKRLFSQVTDLTIVTPSEWLASVVRESFLNNRIIMPLGNGIDLKVFKPVKGRWKERLSIEDKTMILGVANVWSDRKGLVDILELSKIITDDKVIVLVGLSKTQIDGLPSNVYGIERTSNVEDLAGLYSSADVFINPSYEETMGLVTAEALACGTPVVTYDRTAVPEVADDSCGVVVEAGNIHALASGIEAALAKDRQLAIKRALKYDKQRIIQEHIDLYISRIKVSV